MLEISELESRNVGPITLEVSDGCCVAIIGPSGAGKSLLLRAVADLDPNNGSVRLNGQAREEMPAYEWRRKVSFVPAESGWWADRVGDHFVNGDKAEEMLATVGMSETLDWEVNRLSTGERHRLAIVRALQMEPRALLLDEPTAALDADMTNAVERLIRQQMENDVCVLMVTHDEEQAARIAGRSIRLSSGQIVPEAGAAS